MLRKIYEKIRDLNQVHFIIMAVLLAITVFVQPVAFIFVMYLLFVLPFLKTETLIYTKIFLYPLAIVYDYVLGSSSIVLVLTMFCLIKGYVVDLIKKKVKPNLKVIIAFIVVICFVLFFPTHSFDLLKRLDFLISIFPIYLCYEYRKTLKVSTIARIISFTIIFSGLAWVFRDYSPQVQYLFEDVFIRHGMHRCYGTHGHPNMVSDSSILALSLLIYSFYHRQLSVQEFVVLFIGCFLFGYLAIARSFLLSFLVVLICLIIGLVKRDGVYKTLKFILPLSAIILCICIMLSDVTNMYIFRFNTNYEGRWDNMSSTLTPDLVEKIEDGKVHFDPGRIGIFTMYIRYILSTPLVLLFGRGVYAVRIGKLSAHNIVLNIIYNYGIVGILLNFVLYYFLLGGAEKPFKKYVSKKNIIKVFSILLLCIPYLFSQMINIAAFYQFIPTVIIGMYELQNDKYLQPKTLERDKMIEEINYFTYKKI